MSNAGLTLGGVHHVTAVTGNASGNVAFYTEVLGLRLVKRTVNQDDVSAYHLFYGDEVGNPGTEMTFFDWSALPAQRPGAGMVSATAFRVPGREALEWWIARFNEHGVTHSGLEDRAGRSVVAFTDPEGQRLELIDDSQPSGEGVAPGTPWYHGPVPEERAIRGLEGVTLTVNRSEPTVRVLTEVLGFRRAAEYTDSGHSITTFEVGPGGPGAEVRVLERPELPAHRAVGTGGVHHVAFRVAGEEEHREWQRRVAAAGLQPTPVIDRYYFRSIYFREPGGVLFELATDGPGFATDESVDHLGEKLALPPFLEPRRAQIEAGLKPLKV